MVFRKKRQKGAACLFFNTQIAQATSVAWEVGPGRDACSGRCGGSAPRADAAQLVEIRLHLAKQQFYVAAHPFGPGHGANGREG